MLEPLVINCLGGAQLMSNGHLCYCKTHQQTETTSAPSGTARYRAHGIWQGTAESPSLPPPLPPVIILERLVQLSVA